MQWKRWNEYTIMVRHRSQAHRLQTDQERNLRMDKWKAYFYQWMNPYFGTYDVLGFFSEEEMPRLKTQFGDGVENAASWQGDYLQDVDFEKVRFFFIDSKKKVFTPMNVLAYAFGGQYDVLPIGNRLEDFVFDAEGYQFKEHWDDK